MGNTINALNHGFISEEERMFCTLISVGGEKAYKAYKVAFNKHNISGVTASSNASRIVNDDRIQKALWVIYDHYQKKELGFNENVLKRDNPNYKPTYKPRKRERKDKTT